LGEAINGIAGIVLPRSVEGGGEKGEARSDDIGCIEGRDRQRRPFLAAKDEGLKFTSIPVRDRVQRRSEAPRAYPFEAGEDLMCVPACINMILMRRRFKRLPQQLIAHELGLVVPPHRVKEFPSARVSDCEKEWGVHPQDHEASVGRLFDQYDIPLAEQFVSIAKIPADCHGEFLCDQLQEGNDVIVGYDYLTLRGKGKHVAHVSLITDVDPHAGWVWLLDPAGDGRNEPGAEVPLQYLARATWEVHDGFWCIGVKEDLVRAGKRWLGN
jgi:hypothetical protein